MFETSTIRDEHDRAVHRAECLCDSVDEQDRHQARKEASGADDHSIEGSDGFRNGRVYLHIWVKPGLGDPSSLCLLCIDCDFTLRLRAIVVLGTDTRVLDADGPDVPIAGQEVTQRVDRRQEVAAVLLHH